LETFGNDEVISDKSSHVLKDFANKFNCLHSSSSSKLSINSEKINIYKYSQSSSKNKKISKRSKFGPVLPIVCSTENIEKNNKIEKPKFHYTKDIKLFVNYLWDFPLINMGKLHKKLRKYNPNLKHTSCIEIDALLKRATKEELKEVLKPSEFIHIQKYALDKIPPKIPNPYQFLIPKET
jgi:hypothetical protein